MLLELVELRKSYLEPDGKRLPILDIDRFGVEEGEQMVLVGRSGCGKTTLLHVISGIRTADSGRVGLRRGGATGRFQTTT
jgi:putative ABC transport system ATP-binding protein